jgi:flavin-dependent dehydrogenase
MESREVIIIGGGLAGLTAALHLSKLGISVTVFEKNNYPKHKVCGEYISNEVLPYFDWLGVNPEELQATKITELNLSTLKGKNITRTLPLGGFGVSRYTLDNFLYKKAIAQGCEFILESVNDITFVDDEFIVTTSNSRSFKSKVVLGAFGKRSTIDQKMERLFIKQKSPWLAVKGHYKGNFPDNVVGLHNFKGGYCGVSKVENDIMNICYLADFETFKNYKNIEEYQQKVMAENPHLKKIFNTINPLFEKPITISQISFAKKKAVENHILMIGDTAGLIHPLCGNGMAMAIHSAKIASEFSFSFLEGKMTRESLEKGYSKEWNLHFRQRIKAGRRLASVLQQPILSEVMLRILTTFPFLLTLIINKTHGKPITLN